MPRPRSRRPGEALVSADRACPRPDLAADLSMPGMDGRQFLNRLRALPQWKALPVILTTGRTAEEVRGLCDCEVLPKPFSDRPAHRVRRMIGDANEHSRAKLALVEHGGPRNGPPMVMSGGPLTPQDEMR